MEVFRNSTRQEYYLPPSPPLAKSVPEVVALLRLERLSMSSHVPAFKVLSDRYTQQIHSIAALFEKLYGPDTFASEDFHCLENECIALNHLHQKLGELVQPERCQHALQTIKMAEGLVRDSLVFAQHMPKYYEKALAFERALEQMNESAETPLLAIGDIETALDRLNDLWQSAAALKKCPFTFKKVTELFAADLSYFSWQVEDWVDAVVHLISQERKELAALSQGPLAEQAVLQLAAMDDQIVKIAQATKKWLPELKTFDSQECKKSVSSLSSSLKKIGKISVPNSDKLVNGKSVQYGSNQWQQLVDVRPKKEASWLKSLVQCITQPENWSENTKRVVHSVFVGMQLSQQAIGFSSKLHDITEEAEKLHEDAVQDAVRHVSKEQVKQIDRKAAALGVLLSDKLEALKNSPGSVERLTKGYPEIRPALREAFNSSSIDIDTIVDTYRAQAMEHAASVQNPHQPLGFRQWWQLFTAEQSVTPKQEEQSVDHPLSIAAKSSSEVGSRVMKWMGDSEQKQQIQKAHQQLKAAIFRSLQIGHKVLMLPASAASQEVNILHKDLMRTAQRPPDSMSPLPRLEDCFDHLTVQCDAIDRFLEVNAEQLEPGGDEQRGTTQEAILVEPLQFDGAGGSNDEIIDVLKKENELGTIEPIQKPLSPSDSQPLLHEIIQKGVNLNPPASPPQFSESSLPKLFKEAEGVLSSKYSTQIARDVNSKGPISTYSVRIDDEMSALLTLGHEIGSEGFRLKMQFSSTSVTSHMSTTRRLFEWLNDSGYVKMIDPISDDSKNLEINFSVETRKDFDLLLELFDELSHLMTRFMPDFRFFFLVDWKESVKKEYPNLLKDVANAAALKEKGSSEPDANTLIALVEMGYAYEIAFQAAQMMLSSTKSCVTPMFRLVRSLLSKADLYKASEADVCKLGLQAIKKGAEDSDATVRKATYEFFKQLIDTNQCSQQSDEWEAACCAAELAVEKDLKNVNVYAEELMQALVSKGRGFAVAEQFAETMFSKKDYDGYLSMHQALFSVGHVSEKVIENLKDILETNVHLYSLKALGLCEHAISNKKTHDSVTLIMEKLLFEVGFGIEGQIKGHQILEKIVNAGSAYEVAERVVQARKGYRGFNDVFPIGLLRALVRKGQAFNLAIEIAEKERDLELILELISKGQAYELATKLATENSTSNHADPKLILELISKYQAYELATRLAIKNSRSNYAHPIVSALMSHKQYEALATIASKTTSEDLAAHIKSELWWKDAAQFVQDTVNKLKFWK